MQQICDAFDLPPHSVVSILTCSHSSAGDAQDEGSVVLLDVRCVARPLVPRRLACKQSLFITHMTTHAQMDMLSLLWVRAESAMSTPTATWRAAS
jgi:hypothetical protein